MLPSTEVGKQNNWTSPLLHAFKTFSSQTEAILGRVIKINRMRNCMFCNQISAGEEVPVLQYFFFNVFDLFLKS